MLLKLAGFVVWRQNNIGVYDEKKGAFRTSKLNRKGVSDIIGFHKADATFIACEIKTGADELSIHQELFLDDLRNAKGYQFVIRTYEEADMYLLNLD